MKLLELTKLDQSLTKDVLVLLNPELIITLEPFGDEGTVINGTIRVKESIDDIKSSLRPRKKPEY